jgi:hypothetical protein
VHHDTGEHRRLLEDRACHRADKAFREPEDDPGGFTHEPCRLALLGDVTVLFLDKNIHT